MRWCPKCHHPAEAGSRFCSRCGEVLPHRRCDSCGTANEVDAWRCVECGQSLRSVARAAPEANPADDATLALGPLARLAELRAPPASAPTQGASATAATGPTHAAPSAAMPTAMPPEHTGTASSTLAMEALRAAQTLVPHDLDPPAPAPPPGLHRPAAPAPTVPPHLAATLESIARAVADAPSAAAPAATPEMPAPAAAATTPSTRAAQASTLSPRTSASAQAPAWPLTSATAASAAADPVDLYIDVSAPAAMQVDIPLGVEPVTTASPAARGAAPAPFGSPTGGAVRRNRWGIFNRPLVAGAAAGLALAVFVALILHWQRLNNAESSTPTARPAADDGELQHRTPATGATPGSDLPSRPGAPVPAASRQTTPMPVRPSASGAARRAPGADAAADAALEAAGRLLATRPSPPAPGASATPRPARRGGGQ